MNDNRDHRRIGRELALFSFREEAPGQAFWLPEGQRLRAALLDWWRGEHAARGYREVLTPQLYNAGLWERSGHMAKYRDQMYLLDDGGPVLGLKPMNCPGHILVACELLRSYRDLPLRLAEIGHVHRSESSGNRNGLLRACAFSIDDAHIFCAPGQLEAEIDGCLELAAGVYRLFGLDPRVELSTRPAQRIGDDQLWDAAEAALERALHRHGIPHEVRPGEGAFYGPKIDLHLGDSLGRSWQLGTMQLDFTLASRFDLAVADRDDGRLQPVIVHRAMLGSVERFIAILLEHTDGPYRHGWHPCRPLCCRFPSATSPMRATPPWPCGQPVLAPSRAAQARRSAPASAMLCAGACPSCWSPATANRSRGRSPCARPAAPSARSRSPTPPTRSRPPSGRRR